MWFIFLILILILAPLAVAAILLFVFTLENTGRKHAWIAVQREHNADGITANIYDIHSAAWEALTMVIFPKMFHELLVGPEVVITFNRATAAKTGLVMASYSLGSAPLPESDQLHILQAFQGLVSCVLKLLEAMRSHLDKSPSRFFNDPLWLPLRWVALRPFCQEILTSAGAITDCIPSYATEAGELSAELEEKVRVVMKKMA